MQAKEFVVKSIESDRAVYEKAAQHIWEYAETCFEERRSAEELARILEKEGFAVTRSVAGMETAFVAQAGNGKPVLGFLGEYDALPGISQKAGSTHIDPVMSGAPGHGCGHHILGTGAMAAAITVKRYLEHNKLSGTVKFYGCPAEEGGGGKLYMAQEGLFNDTDCAITWHPADDNNIWSMNFMATEAVRVKFRGITAHAPSQVHLGRSALSAAELMNVGANYLRGQVLRDVCINYAFIDAGGVAPNVIPNYAEVTFNIRASTHKRAMETARRIDEIAHGAAMMTQCEVEVEYRGGLSELVPNRTLEHIAYEEFCKIGPTPVTPADEKFCQEMHKAFPQNAETSTFGTLEYLYGPDAAGLISQIKGKVINDVLYPYKEIPHAKYGSTDVCDVSWFTPTMQLTTACYAKDTPGHSWQQVAQGLRPLCYNGMLTAAKVMALTAIRLAENPVFVEKMRSEFDEAMKGREYECPLPNPQMPPHED